MSNMSYCRFRNTLSDLADCQEYLESLLAGDTEYGALSREELNAAVELVETCGYIVQLVAEAAESSEEDAVDTVDRHAKSVLTDANEVLSRADKEGGHE